MPGPMSGGSTVDLAAPGAIGATTPSTIAATTGAFSGDVSIGAIPLVLSSLNVGAGSFPSGYGIFGYSGVGVGIHSQTGKTGFVTSATQLPFFTLDNGKIISPVVGTGLEYKGGSALARAGVATLVSGTVTVLNTTVTTSTVMIVSHKTAGGVLGIALTWSVSAATSFTITSVDSAGATLTTDTSVVSFFMLELNA